MRYLQDRELLQYVERELLPGLAEDCMVDFYDRFQVQLDTTATSLEAIDRLLASDSSALNRADYTAPLGAFLASVFSGTDGARWIPRFERADGADGFQHSRLRIYSEEVDVFGLAAEALDGRRTLTETFQALHRTRPAPGAEL